MAAWFGTGHSPGGFQHLKRVATRHQQQGPWSALLCNQTPVFPLAPHLDIPKLRTRLVASGGSCFVSVPSTSVPFINALHQQSLKESNGFQDME